MQITKPAFIVAELPGVIAAWVREMRLQFEPGIAHLPAEITLAGSSGVGPIAPGQDVASIQRMLTAALVSPLPFEARFIGIGNFPGTQIFYAAPEPGPFNSIHAAIVASGIGFGPSQFSYNAHCSLKGVTPLKPGQREAIESVAVPSQPFTISTVSVYEMERMQSARLFSIDGIKPAQ
jgi:2'-5' RNA ligase superfamily